MVPFLEFYFRKIKGSKKLNTYNLLYATVKVVYLSQKFVRMQLHNRYINHFKEALTGDVEILKKNQNTYSLDMIHHTFVSAIGKNNLECVRYMIENNLVDLLGKPYCDIAAKYSAYECLKYLHEHGCPFRKYTALICLIRNDTMSLHYILQNGGNLNIPSEL